MRVLFVGGTGEISFDCIHESVRLGHEVSVFNRGNNNAGLPAECRRIAGDVADDAAYGELAKGAYDVVCQFRLFTPAAIRRDIGIFAGRCGQYVFISSASAYQKPVRTLPITEETPLENPYWAYSRAKAEMEGVLRAQSALPFTIVRPSHTYRTRMPTPIRGSVSRLLRGKPAVVHDDGESLWTVTHAEEFARPFARLLGNPRALGEAFHITSERAWTWNEIYAAIGAALGIERPALVHVPTARLIEYNPAWKGPLLGDKAASVVFDNSKVKSVAGDFECAIDIRQGMRLVAERYPPRPEDYDPEVDALVDRIVWSESRGAESTGTEPPVPVDSAPATLRLPSPVSRLF